MKDQEIRDFYKDLMLAVNQHISPVMSDEFCCKLLAWLYAYGGGCEAVVLNMKLSTDIFIAQERLNVKGGEKPNQQTFYLLQKYLKEVQPAMMPTYSRPANWEHPIWAYEVCDKYEISHNIIR